MSHAVRVAGEVGEAERSLLARLLVQADTVPPSPRLAVLWRLLDGVRRHGGLSPTQGLAERLLRLTESMSDPALAERAAMMQHRSSVDPEWLALIGALAVHETSFLRDPPQFALFRTQVLPALIAQASATGRRVLRLGSAGCASGEEAYTIAMLLLEALVAAGEAHEGADGIIPASAWRLQVTGCDVAPQEIARAEAGRYADGDFSSMRGLPDRLGRFLPAVRDAHVGTMTNTLHAVRSDLRAITSFVPCNLAQQAPPGGPFDALFCRNVLIYFAPAARQMALRRLQDAVRPGGYLLLGNTDRPDDDVLFRPLWGDDAVAYRRGGGTGLP